MSEFKIDVKPEDVNEAIVKAVLASSVGSIIISSIEKQVIELANPNSYNNPITKAIEGILAHVIEEEIAKRMEDIRKIIAEHLTDKMLKDVVGKFADYVARNRY